MLMKELSTQVTKQDISSLLEVLKANHISNLNDYLLFNLDDKMKKELLQNITFLEDDSLWTIEELTTYQVIAKTIDNDFILSDNSTTLVIPSYLNKSDSEIFQLPIWHFFIQFEEKTLNTTILALN